MNVLGINIRWQDLLEILIFSFIIYRLLLFIRGRRAFQVFLGVLIIIFVGLLSQILEFHAISVLLRGLFAIWIIALLIIFQPELRRGLTRISKVPSFSFFLGNREKTVFSEDAEKVIIDELVNAVSFLSRNKYGALIVIQREVGLKDYIETGVIIDANLSSELLTTIFTPHTLLHDGAVIIIEDRIVAANCILPLQEESVNMRSIGSRHQAALTLSKETDALILVVSEETGRVSLSSHGTMRGDLDSILLKDALKKFSSKKKWAKK